MKKTLILLALFLAFTLVSCGNNNQVKNENDIQKIENDAKK
jgi:protein involved in sex pheromone biosynthesis